MTDSADDTQGRRTITETAFEALYSTNHRGVLWALCTGEFVAEQQRSASG